jgi:hypothetical protein
MVLPDYCYQMLLFCRARHALINRPNGIAAGMNDSANLANARRKRRNKKSPANFAGPFSGPEARA